jgi:hypothetical protein
MATMILVSVAYDGGTAQIARDERGAWLEEMLLGAGPTAVGIGGGRLAIGGLLPAGAARAIVDGVEAATGGGAWLAVVNSLAMFGDPPVRFETVDGVIVRPELPSDWEREAVADADEPCPACGGGSWDRVTPTDSSRGMQGSSGAERPVPVIVCVRCGHEESEGVWFAPVDENSDVPAVTRQRPEPPPLDELDFPVYVLAGSAAEVAGRGWDPLGVHSITMRHGGVQIETEALRHADPDAREASARALADVVSEANPPRWESGSPASMALRLHAHDRSIAARVARSEPFTAELSVDGEPVRFEGLRGEAGWAAVGRTARVQLTVSAHGTAPEAVALRRL